MGFGAPFLCPLQTTMGFRDLQLSFVFRPKMKISKLTILIFLSAAQAAPQYYYDNYYDYYERRQDPISASEVGYQFNPQQVMSEAKNYAATTRLMADFLDRRGADFLSMLGNDYSSEGNTISHVL